ncbi:MAG: pilus assembly protein [Asticcacaulis sp.]
MTRLRSRPGVAGRFWRARDGATALEFAILAAPFIMLLVACFELALVMVCTVSMDMATAKVSREIRTGIVTSGNSSVTTFRTQLCAQMTWLPDCSSKLKVDVRTFNDFNLVTQATDPIKDGAFDDSQIAYTIGTGSKIQLVRVYYPWKIMSPFLAPGFRSLSTGEVVVESQAVFKNEPF